MTNVTHDISMFVVIFLSFFLASPWPFYFRSGVCFLRLLGFLTFCHVSLSLPWRDRLSSAIPVLFLCIGSGSGSCCAPCPTSFFPSCLYSYFHLPISYLSPSCLLPCILASLSITLTFVIALSSLASCLAFHFAPCLAFCLISFYCGFPISFNWNYALNFGLLQ